MLNSHPTAQNAFQSIPVHITLHGTSTTTDSTWLPWKHSRFDSYSNTGTTALRELLEERRRDQGRGNVHVKRERERVSKEGRERGREEGRGGEGANHICVTP